MTLVNKIEALLFASGRYMTPGDLADLTGESQKKVEKALEELKERLEDSENSLALVEANNNYKMSVKEEYQDMVRKIVADTELSTPVLETLAVVAWKRPVLQSEVVNIRGDHAYQHIKDLMELGFISREKHGRTYKLKLSKKFFEYFDVEGEQEIRELFDGMEKPEPELSEEEKQEIRADQKELDEIEMEVGDMEVDKDDLVEKRKDTQEELDELDKELDEISKRTDEAVSELDEFKDDEEEDGEDKED